MNLNNLSSKTNEYKYFAFILDRSKKKFTFTLTKATKLLVLSVQQSKSIQDIFANEKTSMHRFKIFSNLSAVYRNEIVHLQNHQCQANKTIFDDFKT